MWHVLGELSDDQRLAVFPAVLAAPNQAAFNLLVDHSIKYRPQEIAHVRPFVIGQVLGPRPFGLRSLQKIRMMRNLFGNYGCTTHSLVVLADSAVMMGVRIAPATNEWQAAMSGPGAFVEAVPVEAGPALDACSLLLMFGHGSRGNACSLSLKAFANVSMTNKIVMCGDCYSAAALGPSISPRTDADDGKPLQQKEGSFGMSAVENGAVVVYAHMAENAGFPHLFPVLEGWMDGLTVGEAYQRLVNALLAFNQLSLTELRSRGAEDANCLLYVIIGDPALQPLARTVLATPRAGSL